MMESRRWKTRWLSGGGWLDASWQVRLIWQLRRRLSITPVSTKEIDVSQQVFPKVDVLFANDLNHEVQRSSAANVVANSSIRRCKEVFSAMSAAALRQEWRTVV